MGRFGHGGWRGLSTPSVQVHRFASEELADTVKRMWDLGIENPEVRELLLQIVGVGNLSGCADIAYGTAMDGARAVRERALAIEALLRLKDPRLEEVSASVESDVGRWPDSAARRALVDLFPDHMPVARLSKILRRVSEKPRSISDLNFRLPREIETAWLSDEYLDQLRQALTDLVLAGITWNRDAFPHLRRRGPISQPRSSRPAVGRPRKALEARRGLSRALLWSVSRERITAKRIL